jgi:hypothetical protein
MKRHCFSPKFLPWISLSSSPLSEFPITTLSNPTIPNHGSSKSFQLSFFDSQTHSMINSPITLFIT